MAAPCPPWLKEEWIAWIGGEKILELYGGTEGQTITVIDGNEWMAHKGSVGKPLALGEMKAFSADGTMLGPRETGEIYLRRDPSLPPSYRYVGAEPRTLPGGWESLGDIGWFDEEGYLYLTDRRHHMIISGGVNIYPQEAENLLVTHPKVLDAAVFGIPDDEMGQSVKGVVQTLDPADAIDEFADELMGWLRERLAHYKCPRSISFEAQPPRTDTGKLYKQNLVAKYSAHAPK